MANPEHVELVKRGADAIAEWRKSNADIELDLSEADLSKVDLSRADLHEADFGQANLREAVLHAANLKKAALCFAHLGNADLRDAWLYDVDLLQAELRGAQLNEAKFNNAFMMEADLSEADLTGAIFLRADLNGADLRDANLSQASFEEARLEKANLTGANLYETDFELADLRGAVGFHFNCTRTMRAKFSARCSDPWSALRRAYTGPKLAFMIMFTLAALLPYFAKTMFWVGVSNIERRTLPLATTAIAKMLDTLEKIDEPIPPGLATWKGEAREFLVKCEPWLERYRNGRSDSFADAHDVARAIELIDAAQDVIPSTRKSLEKFHQEAQEAEAWLVQAQQLNRIVRPLGKVKQRRIAELLLGFDQGILWSLLIIILLLYNVLRGVLTYFVGPLREEEDRTGFTPSWKGFSGYGWLWHTHRIARVIFWISLASALYQFVAVLSTRVLIIG